MKNFKYEGFRKRKNYFEGWFLRISDDNNNCYSFIFGITLNEEDPHSFIQVIDLNDNKSYYYRFNINEFSYNDKFIKIKNNVISPQRLKLLVDSFDIDLSIKPTLFLKKRLLPGGVMSILKYLPLPIKHEIIFMNSHIKGTIKTNNREFKIKGHGYMEKDMGIRFPKKWLWIQTNSFEKSNASLVLSKADIINKIYGFFCYLNIDGKELRFTTYDGAKIKHFYDENIIKITLRKGNYKLIVEVQKKPGSLIIAPISNAKMERKIEESLGCTMEIFLYKNNFLIFRDTAVNVACEYLY